jgi:hypothetical protein
MRRLTKFGIYPLITAVIICTFSLTVSAWGPSNREAFTTDNPPDYVVFNSITNNPRWGDERGFAFVREIGTGEWSYGAELAPGKTYEIIAYYHNNASASSNGLNFDGPGVARGAYVRAEIPSVVDGEVFGNIVFGAENASPNEVWSSITFTSGSPLELRYVDGTAKLHNFAEPVRGSPERTFNLSSNIFGERDSNLPPAFIGFDAMDGMIPGGQFYDGYISFQVSVPGKSVPDAIENAVSAAVFAAFLALFVCCLCVDPARHLWDTYFTDNTKGITKQKELIAVKVEKKKAVRHKFVVLSVMTLLAIAVSFGVSILLRLALPVIQIVG